MTPLLMKLRNRLARRRADRDRRGGFTVLAAASLIATIAMSALSVDLGMIAYTRTRLQNAADAAALAAAQEISATVEEIGEEGGQAGDANAIAEGAARAMAVRVADLNGVYVDPQRDVAFGKRVYDKQSGKFSVLWGQGPYNVVKVTPRMDNPDTSAPDGELEMFFAPIFGIHSHAIAASASGFVEARDLVLVLDYTASMNDDSTFAAFGDLGRSAVEENQLQIFDELGLDLPELPETPQYPTVGGVPASGAVPHIDVTFKGTEIYVTSTKDLSNVVLELLSPSNFSSTRTQKFEGLSGKTGTFKGTGSNNGWIVVKCWIKSGSNASGEGPGYGERFEYVSAIKEAFGLDVAYPYPGGGWDEFISHSIYYSRYNYWGGYNYKYGKKTFVEYLLNSRHKSSDTPDLWKTSHYPFHAMKEGATLFCDFLDDLDFGDHLGLVTYDEWARIEDRLVVASEGLDIDITASPITDDYAAVNAIQRHKQAGHYASYTGIGFGIAKAVDLIEDHGRYGARPTILVMTDGNANRAPDGWEVPDDWSFDDLTDYDGDGEADFTTGDVNKVYAFYEAKRAIDAGYTVHTMSVGANSDPDLMEAIAFASGGEFINVPGGSTIAQMEEELRDAFTRIAANVPPAKLLIERD